MGRRLMVAPEHDAGIVRELATHFDRHGTVAFANYPVSRELMGAGEER